MLFPSESPLQVLCAWTLVSGIDGGAWQLQLVVDAGIKPSQALDNSMVGWTGSIPRFVEHPSDLRDGFSALKLMQGWQGEARDKNLLASGCSQLHRVTTPQHTVLFQ